MHSEKGIARRVKQHVIAKRHSFFAVVHPGFEETAAREIAELGISETAERTEGGLEFITDLAGCYRANLCARTVTRVLMRLARFKALHFTLFRKKMAGFPWELHLAPGAAVSFSIACRHSRLYHTGRLREECMGAVAERMKEQGMEVSFPEKPSDDNAVQGIFLRLEDDVVHVSLDASGEMLYRRGSKTQITPAPLRETAAACILIEAGLGKYDILIDPMGGSGTFSLEAGMIFSGHPPGLGRDFIFRRWPAFREAAFHHLVKQLEEGKRAEGKSVLYSDIDPEAVAAAENNITAAGLTGITRITQKDFFKDRGDIPAGKKALLVLNPPYGKRLRGKEDTAAVYRKIGQKIRKDYANCGYAIIVPGLELEKVLSLPYDKKVLFRHGGIRVSVIIRYAV